MFSYCLPMAMYEHRYSCKNAANYYVEIALFISSTFPIDKILTELPGG